jgi:two-component system chemotaxis response regulator CheY
VIRELLRRYLSMRGHAVVVAADGLHALRLADQASFDVVISDLHMPGMNGQEVIRRLRALPSGSATRFVLSTGDAPAPAARPPDQAGDVIMVHKPYDVDMLARLIEAER